MHKPTIINLFSLTTSKPRQNLGCLLLEAKHLLIFPRFFIQSYMVLTELNLDCCLLLARLPVDVRWALERRMDESSTLVWGTLRLSPWPWLTTTVLDPPAVIEEWAGVGDLTLSAGEDLATAPDCKLLVPLAVCVFPSTITA